VTILSRIREISRSVLFQRDVSNVDGAQLSKVALGKYIILLASVLHLVWAGLLLFAAGAENSTPVAIISRLCGGPERAAAVLAVVSIAALAFLYTKRTKSNATVSALLVPQQLLLFLSAGAGLWSAIRESYADGVIRDWAFILSDQLPVILLSILYTVVVLEAASEPNRALPERPGRAQEAD
jgi:hypothetical protein